MLKKTFAVIGTLALALTLASCGAKSDEQLMEEGWVKNPAEHGWVKDPAANGWVEAPKALPANQTTSYEVEDQVINYKNLSQYMLRTDVAYIDLRDAQKGYNQGHLRGFESVEFFGTIKGSGVQLFDDNLNARYQESEAIINRIFPKDKAIFLNCAIGGRVKTMMKLLNNLGYDMTKVYNVGGWTQFQKEATLKPYLVLDNGFTATTKYEINTEVLHPIA